MTTDTYHGTLGGYSNHKCRCEQCRAAAAEYHRRRRVPCISCGAPVYRRAHGAERYCRACFAATLEIPLDEVHGTELGYKKGCRCVECREASSEARRERRRVNPEVERTRYRTYRRIRRWRQMSLMARATSTLPARIAAEEGISLAEARRMLNTAADRTTA